MICYLLIGIPLFILPGKVPLGWTIAYDYRLVKSVLKLNPFGHILCISTPTEDMTQVRHVIEA